MFARSTSILAHVTTALVAAAAGWTANESTLPPPVMVAAQPPALPQPAVVRPRTSAPLIAVARDGNVTLRVEQQPLQWVLDEIAAQAGWPELRQRASAATVQVAASPAV